MTTPAQQSTSQPPATIRRPTLPGNPHQHAHKIAEAVDTAWHQAHGHGRIELPVSVVAALSFLAPDDANRDQAAAALLGLDPAQFARLVRAQWAIFIRARPDLVNRVWPLIEPWYGNPPLHHEALWAAKKVADSAIRAGQLHLTGTHRRADTDLFGVLLSVLRTRSAKTARGQFYTSGDVAELMAHLLELSEQDSVHEPAAGTGGMLRAVATVMRRNGRDPATMTWVAVDIDELAVACLACNVVLWGLGTKVLLGVGNGLSDDWITRAQAERQETLALAESVRTSRLALRLLTAVTGTMASESLGDDQQ